MNVEAETRRMRQSIMTFEADDARHSGEGGSGNGDALEHASPATSKRSTLLLNRKAHGGGAGGGSSGSRATLGTSAGANDDGAMPLSKSNSRASTGLTGIVGSPGPRSPNPARATQHSFQSINESDAENGKRKPKSINFSRMTIEEIAELSATEVGEVWTMLDSDRNGMLDKRELRVLATELSEAVLRQVERTIKAQMPHLAEKSLRSAAEKEMKFILPIKANSDNPTRDFAKHLQSKLDIDGDGQCSRLEFHARWGTVTKEIVRLSHENAHGHDVGCAIV